MTDEKELASVAPLCLRARKEDGVRGCRGAAFDTAARPAGQVYFQHNDQVCLLSAHDMGRARQIAVVHHTASFYGASQVPAVTRAFAESRPECAVVFLIGATTTTRCGAPVLVCMGFEQHIQGP